MKPAATSLGSQAPKMSDGLEKGWRLSYTMRPEEIRGVGMPEPQHRIGPAGVSSGISLRDFPKARLEDLTKICQHYEQKCSGVYASDSAAARYLFQLSREVQQVVAVLSQEKLIQTRAAEKAGKFLEEWKESFGPSAPLIRDASSLEIPLSYGGVHSSGESGSGTKGDGEKDDGEMLTSDGGDIDTVSPAKVAEALRSLSFRVVNAKKKTAEATMEKESSMAGMRGVLDAHVSASAESSEANRLIHLEVRAAMAEQQKKVVETLREQHEQAIQQIIVEKDLEHNKSCESFKKQLNEVQLELLNNRQHTINTEAQWRKRVEDLEQRERAEASRMREHFQEQLTRAKNEAAAAHAALGVSSVSEGGRRSGGGARSSSGNGLGPDGGSEVDAGSDDHKVRSLSIMLEESRKECKWVRERNQELERVVEALRKTIMRQAEISSQRPDQQQGRMMSMHGHRGSRQPHLDHAHHGGGAGYSMGGPRGPRSGGDHSYQDTSGLTARGGGGQHHHSGLTSSRDDDILLHRNRQGGVHAGGGHRGHDESAAYTTRFHQQQQHQGFNNAKVGNGGRVRSGVVVSGAMSSAGSNSGVGGRSHPHQMQQLPEAPPFRRYATHDSYEEGIGLPSSTAGAQLRQQHSTSRLLLRGVPGGGERGGTHPGNVPGSSPYDRDLPDRGWSQSAPPLGNAGGPHGAGGTMTGRMGGNHGVIGGRGGGIEYAAPVPRHHRQHEGGGHNLAAIGSLSASTSAGMGKEGSSNGGVSASGVGGVGGARWDRDPPRDTMAFASSKYPPGCFPSGGVYGEGAIFEQVPLMDKRNGSFKGSPTSRGTVGSGVGGVLRGNGDIQMHRQQQEEAHMANSRSLGMLTGSPNTEGVVHAGRLMASGMKSNDVSPDMGPATGFDLGNGRGKMEGRERGGVTKEDDGDTGDFDFGEIDTAAVLGL